MKKKILVTGAAGFIGSNLANFLIKKKYEVWTIDNLSTGNLKNLNKSIIFINGDCSNKNTIKKLKNNKFKYIFHFAGQSSGEISFENPCNDFKSNVQSTIYLAEYALKNQCQKFFYASSMSVYGDTHLDKSKESDKCNPLSFYGIGKLTSENYLMKYKKKGLNPVILRFFNVYGPNQNFSNLKQGMISIYLAQILNSKKLFVKGSLNRFRDFIYIDDAIEAIFNLCKKNTKLYPIINIGTGKKTTIKQLIEIISKIINKDIKLKVISGTIDDQFGVYANTKILQNHYNFKAKTNLKLGIKKFIDWKINN